METGQVAAYFQGIRCAGNAGTALKKA